MIGSPVFQKFYIFCLMSVKLGAMRMNMVEHAELTKNDVKMYLLFVVPAERLCSAAAPVTEQLSNCERWWLALAERGGVC